MTFFADAEWLGLGTVKSYANTASEKRFKSDLTLT